MGMNRAIPYNMRIPKQPGDWDCPQVFVFVFVFVIMYLSVWQHELRPPYHL